MNIESRGSVWFWGGDTRAEFERKLAKDAVQLHDGKTFRPPVQKHSPEAIKARRDALLKAGVLTASKPKGGKRP